MNINFPNIKESSDDWKTARTQVQRDLEQASKNINTSWKAEHTVEGGHGDIEPTSITVQGATLGEWVDLPFNGGRYYTGGLSVWTVVVGNMNFLKAMRIGQLVFLMFRIESTKVTVDTADALYMKLPEFNAIPTAGTAIAQQTWFGGSLEWSDITNGTSGIGSVNAVVQPFDPYPITTISLNRVTPTNATFGTWAISDDLSIGGSMWFPVNPDNAPMTYSFV